MKGVRPDLVEFAECASCAAKPGSPTLCPACLHNRTTINELRAECEALTKVYGITGKLRSLRLRVIYHQAVSILAISLSTVALVGVFDGRWTSVPVVLIWSFWSAKHATKVHALQDRVDGLQACLPAPLPQAVMQ